MSAEIVSILTELLEFPNEMELRALQEQRANLLQAEKELKRQLDDVQRRLLAINGEMQQRLRAAEEALKRKESGES